MPFSDLTTFGMFYPPFSQQGNSLSLSDSTAIDSTGEKLAFVGRVWWPGGSGSKDIRRVGFRFGTITKSGGSGLTVSLQNVLLTGTTSLGVPDETQDQTVAIANADAGFASNTWYRTDTLSADRTVSVGDLLAVVVEYDISGRSAPDSVTLSGHGTVINGQPQMLVKTASWAQMGRNPNLVLEFSDGTFGNLFGAGPVAASSVPTLISTASPDEYGNEISFPFPVVVEGVWVYLNVGNARDFEISVYENASVSPMTNGTISVDGQEGTNSLSFCKFPFSAPLTLKANTNYITAVRATSTTGPQIWLYTVPDVAHKPFHGLNLASGLRSRTDTGGSWSAVETSRFTPSIGFVISEIGRASTARLQIGTI